LRRLKAALACRGAVPEDFYDYVACNYLHQENVIHPWAALKSNPTSPMGCIRLYIQSKQQGSKR